MQIDLLFVDQFYGSIAGILFSSVSKRRKESLSMLVLLLHFTLMKNKDSFNHQPYTILKLILLPEAYHSTLHKEAINKSIFFTNGYTLGEKKMFSHKCVLIVN